MELGNVFKCSKTLHVHYSCLVRSMVVTRCQVLSPKANELHLQHYCLICLWLTSDRHFVTSIQISLYFMYSTFQKNQRYPPLSPPPYHWRAFASEFLICVSLQFQEILSAPNLGPAYSAQPPSAKKLVRKNYLHLQ